MKPGVSCAMLLALLALIPVSAATADGIQRAQALALQLQEQATASVATARGRVVAARSELQSARTTASSIRLARDPAADAVAAEAVAIAEAGLADANRLLARAEALLLERQRTVEALQAGEPGDRPARGYVIPVQGVVERRGSGGAVLHDAGPVMRPGESATTGPGAEARMFLGGGRTEVALGEESELTLDQDDDDGLLATLRYGIARFKAAFDRTRFEVRTPPAVCAVRGTVFAVQTRADWTRVDVFEGVVSLTPADGGDAVEIRADESREFVTGRGFSPAVPLEQTQTGQQGVFDAPRR